MPDKKHDTPWLPPTHPETLEDEDPFRTEVRNILDLSWDARDEAIFARLRELKDRLINPGEFRVTNGR